MHENVFITFSIPVTSSFVWPFDLRIVPVFFVTQIIVPPFYGSSIHTDGRTDGRTKMCNNDDFMFSFSPTLTFWPFNLKITSTFTFTSVSCKLPKKYELSTTFHIWVNARNATDRQILQKWRVSNNEAIHFSRTQKRCFSFSFPVTLTFDLLISKLLH